MGGMRAFIADFPGKTQIHRRDIRFSSNRRIRSLFLAKPAYFVKAGNFPTPEMNIIPKMMIKRITTITMNESKAVSRIPIDFPRET